MLPQQQSKFPVLQLLMQLLSEMLQDKGGVMWADSVFML